MNAHNNMFMNNQTLYSHFVFHYFDRGRPRRAAAQKKKPEPASDDAMEESSSDEEEAELDEMDTAKLIKDAEDQKQLDALPEIEREAILAERFEKLKAEREMKKAMKEIK